MEMKAGPSRKNAILGGIAVGFFILSAGLWWLNHRPAKSTVVEDLYASGERRSRSEVSNDLLNGLSEGWYTNGQLQVTEHYVDGVSHGLRTKWYASGKKKSEAQIANGQINGTYTRWYEEGGLAEQATFKQGVPDGKSMAYYPSGCLKAEVLMAEGKPAEQTFWKDGERKP
jgi:antitoxin component YwqK of YwqJK toxin-antitoxin module